MNRVINSEEVVKDQDDQAMAAKVICDEISNTNTGMFNNRVLSVNFTSEEKEVNQRGKIRPMTAQNSRTAHMITEQNSQKLISNIQQDDVQEAKRKSVMHLRAPVRMNRV